MASYTGADRSPQKPRRLYSLASLQALAASQGSPGYTAAMNSLDVFANDTLKPEEDRSAINGRFLAALRAEGSGY
jgi:hypothetical protein